MKPSSGAQIAGLIAISVALAVLIDGHGLSLPSYLAAVVVVVALMCGLIAIEHARESRGFKRNLTERHAALIIGALFAPTLLVGIYLSVSNRDPGTFLNTALYLGIGIACGWWVRRKGKRRGGDAT